jgi:hypothetical protein
MGMYKNRNRMWIVATWCLQFWLSFTEFPSLQPCDFLSEIESLKSRIGISCPKIAFVETSDGMLNVDTTQTDLLGILFRSTLLVLRGSGG